MVVVVGLENLVSEVVGVGAVEAGGQAIVGWLGRHLGRREVVVEAAGRLGRHRTAQICYR